MANEVLKAAVKNLIPEYGTADAARIGARLGWGPDRLKAWLLNPLNGLENDAELDAVCRDLCEKGFRS